MSRHSSWRDHSILGQLQSLVLEVLFDHPLWGNPQPLGWRDRLMVRWDRHFYSNSSCHPASQSTIREEQSSGVMCLRLQLHPPQLFHPFWWTDQQTPQKKPLSPRRSQNQTLPPRGKAAVAGETTERQLPGGGLQTTRSDPGATWSVFRMVALT